MNSFLSFYSRIFIIILLFSLITNASTFFRSKTKLPTKSISSKECCISPKMSINSQKANHGKDFLRQLTINSDLYEKANPENMCNLMHFLFQQASINNRPFLVTEEIFILFDSSNQVFDRIIQTNKHQQYNTISNEFKFRSYLNPRRYIGRRNIDVSLRKKNQSNENFNERYETYGMDISGSCLPNNFDHIIFGELPPILNDDKYNGRSMFIKPTRLGSDSTKLSSVIKDVKSFVKQRFCQLIRGETKSECAKLRAFKDNIDKILLKKWTQVLANLPSKWKINQQYIKRAVKYTIHEMDQQSKDLEAAGAGKDVKRFRKLLIEKYGQDDIRVRKGREIIFTTTELKQTHLTCQSNNDRKKC